MLALNEDDATDDQGFPLSEFAPRTANFIDCSWSIPHEAANDAGEDVIGQKPREYRRYEITIASSVVVESSDRIELKEDPNVSDIRTLEVTAVTNQTNVAKMIYATELAE